MLVRSSDSDACRQSHRNADGLLMQLFSGRRIMRANGGCESSQLRRGLPGSSEYRRVIHAIVLKSPSHMAVGGCEQ